MPKSKYSYHLNHPYLIPFDSSWNISQAPTASPDLRSKSDNRALLEERVKELSKLQELLYAHDRFSILCIFQAMDAAGKDSTIRAVFTGVNPAGFQVFAFKKPSDEALDHDFLWRSSLCLPERGRIGVFNRSYYEEVLIVKVHPEIMANQKIPSEIMGDEFWEDRLNSIRDHELHLARNGMVILKFFLNISLTEQRKRFLNRLEKPEKNWKFSTQDMQERQHWGKYMAAYNTALNATSRPWAPWYAIPADDKSQMRAAVAEIILETVKTLPLSFPIVPENSKKEIDNIKKQLKKELGSEVKN
jgi:PPK2 family polyphosphate:nucleotide phosphotransferase